MGSDWSFQSVILFIVQTCRFGPQGMITKQLIMSSALHVMCQMLFLSHLYIFMGGTLNVISADTSVGYVVAFEDAWSSDGHHRK